jgi:tagaturonate epimerase
VEVIPVWNKSNREHLNVHTTPESVRAEADAAVKQLGWDLEYHVDADHIGLATVDAFIQPCDFFTLDVADAVGMPAAEEDIHDFVRAHRGFAGELRIAGIAGAIAVGEDRIADIARKYLAAVGQAGAIYRRIAEVKGGDRFVIEVSMDETDNPQAPVDLLFILAALAAEGIPAETIAPRFCGRFNKGVDYIGDVVRFEKEFNDDLAVVAFAVREFGLPLNLKLSVHSGSDKFSIFGPIARALRVRDAGVHVKTSGTTWLEEVAGLALAGGDGLELAKEIYEKAYGRRDELCAPYATVIEIDPARLPLPQEVWKWSSKRFVETLRHDPESPVYSKDFRQMVHVGYKVASEMGERYLRALEENEASIAPLVTENLFEKHLRPLFL